MKCLSRRIFLIAAIVAITLSPRLHGQEPQRDFVFLMSSDPHVGSWDPKAKPPVSKEQVAAAVRRTLDDMLGLAGQPYPAVKSLPELPPGKFAQPRGVLIAGDLTDYGDWPRFEEIFPAVGVGPANIPVFLGIGNHDGDPKSPTRLGVLARNRQLWNSHRIGSISDNGLHYAWTWEGVHFVCVNLCPADSTDAQTLFKYGHPGPGSWNDPLGALSFLKDYLHKCVRVGEPVIIWQHYGYCEGFNFDWNWWTAKQRREFYDVIKDCNVVALLHGHTHAPARYRWPDAKEDPREVERLFGKSPPKDLRSFDVFSGGSFGGGTYYLFRVLSDRLIALHHDRWGWTNDSHLNLVKAMSASPGQPGKSVMSTDPPEQGFFSKRLDYEDIPIKSHCDVADAALLEAKAHLEMMLGKLPAVRQKLKAAGAELHIIGRNQVTSDLPEHRHLKGKPFDGKQTVDERTRGLGGLLVSCGEENLLRLEKDRYRGRDICVHEFAHCIRDYGMSDAQRQRFHDQRERSLADGLWIASYAGSNDHEFFAELSMWYWGTHGDMGMKGKKPAHGPAGLKAYDPKAYTLFDDFYSGR